MLNQNFSARSFMRLLTKQDVARYALGSGIDAYQAKLTEVEAALAAAEFEFSPFRRSRMSHGDVISPSCLIDDFALRKLNDNIKRVFNIKTVDRNRIVPQVKVLLSETGDFWLHKLDLRRFFESVDRDEVVRIVCEDHRLSFESKTLLKKLFSCTDLKSGAGLPRGIALSSTLSELYMREFDNACRRLETCYFYMRYVDDIVMLFHEEPRNVLPQLQLPPGLSFNDEKCSKLFHPQKGAVVTSDGNSSVTYLGYEFSFLSTGQAKPSRLCVGIAAKKIRKLKTRIALALFDFCKNEDFYLLKKRISFLSSNYKIGKDSERGNLYAGIHYNHSLIDDERLKDLEGIDEYLRKSLFSKKGSLGKKLSTLLTDAQRRELCSISMLQGFKRKIVRSFTPTEFRVIKGAWAHV
ncbi:RNA-directed DNA polymerase [Paraburkholderia sediminicola]|uniref:antiviral reverse transcriptase Drt3a n=1 Tax=Paraburkholderia sediminicola TaxID=458836 RepID=UPI0038B94820